MQAGGHCYFPRMGRQHDGLQRFRPSARALSSCRPPPEAGSRGMSGPRMPLRPPLRWRVAWLGRRNCLSAVRTWTCPSRRDRLGRRSACGGPPDHRRTGDRLGRHDRRRAGDPPRSGLARLLAQSRRGRHSRGDRLARFAQSRRPGDPGAGKSVGASPLRGASAPVRPARSSWRHCWPRSPAAACPRPGRRKKPVSGIPSCAPTGHGQTLRSPATSKASDAMVCRSMSSMGRAPRAASCCLIS